MPSRTWYLVLEIAQSDRYVLLPILIPVSKTISFACSLYSMLEWHISMLHFLTSNFDLCLLTKSAEITFVLHPSSFRMLTFSSTIFPSIKIRGLAGGRLLSSITRFSCSCGSVCFLFKIFEEPILFPTPNRIRYVRNFPILLDYLSGASELFNLAVLQFQGL